ncbi:Ig-like domain-containing protein [Neobacillus sp. OS1-33]|uniref:Ig-like domain-containing protein n=1 Tax=Neobacillus sp. OS1-33 TaxID=3070683 RepID=UPI0027DF8DC9|nr:Ig-like domain-containing protein [Neobacillus sp. OS1-33]WML24885.1 cytochrome c3 family protein [Neobacillus sp. OS1-33]
MKEKGLLHKTKLHVLIILVLCIQIFGSYQISGISVVKAAGTGTDPSVTIVTPESGAYLNTGNVTISGTVGNYTTGMKVNLLNGTVPIGTPYEVNGDSWIITDIALPEGTYNIIANLVDAQGITVASTTLNNLTIDLTPPNITFVNLVEGAFSKSRSVELATEADSTVQICRGSCDSTTGTWLTVPKDSNGKWIYTDLQMAEGTQTFSAKAIDRAGNEGTPQRITFTLDTLRPTILMNSIVPTYTEDMTHVSINTEIKFRVSDANVLKETEINKSIRVTSKGKDIPGDVQYDKVTNEISFIPTVRPLSLSTKYNVFISPLGVIDSAGNSAFPRFWSFTTESAPPTRDAVSGKDLYGMVYNGQNVRRESPHAAYANNVNICANCHSTHEASNPNLLDQKQNSGSSTTQLSVDDYCMACHDGTVAPIPENSQATHKHSAAIDISGKPSGSSCASCHNPHIERSDGNPNLAQDHIVYTHAPNIQKDNNPVGKVSSKEQLCENCHESGLSALVAKPDVVVEYRVFQYKKNISAIGIYENYDLCLRCHNLNTKNKYNGIADIASFYNNLTEETKKEFETSNSGLSYSNREISLAEKEFSSHIIKAQDGSPLTGHIPCAECHDTHGSANIKNLKESLGHEDIKTFSAGDADRKSVKVQIGSNERDFTILTDSKEREFCLACHNGTTAIYGVTGQKYDDTRTEHKDYPGKACSYCHGRGETEVEKALSASHAPKKGIVPTP